MTATQYDDFAKVLMAKDRLDEIYSRDCWRWLCQQVMTVDESSDAEISGNRIRPWPRLKYLYDVIQVLRNEQLVGIPKSRRMMLSWCVAAFFTWDARYHGNSALFWMSQTERKAAYQVDKRCYFIETHLKDKAIRQHVKTIRTKDSLVGSLTYGNGSYIWAVPEGGDVLRNYTPSRVMVDECEFLPSAPEVYRATVPLLDQGAQGIFVSSSNGPSGILAEVCKEIGFSSWYDIGKLKAA